MPKLPIRSFLRASKGNVLIAFDLAQAESWVTAFLADCAEMKNALQFGDIHVSTTRIIYDLSPDDPYTKDQRYLAKKFNHSFNYGTSPMMIAHMINVESINPPYMSITVAEAKKLHDKMKQAYWEIPRWWESIQQELSNTRTLRTPYGRKRNFKGAWGTDLFKEAYSYIPQSTVADHTLGAIQPELRLEGGLRGIYNNVIVPSNAKIKAVNTAHDSVIVDCPREQAEEVAYKCYHLLRRPLLINGEEFIIPVDCEMGERWGELEEIPRSKFL